MTIVTASDLVDDPDEEDHIQAEILEGDRARATVDPRPQPTIATDGGDGEYEFPQLHVADTVEDREDSDANMLVHALPSETAADHEIDEKGTTVAHVNPDYPADDDVVIVKFPQRTDSTLEPLQKYAYPRSRLRLVEPFHDRDDVEGGDE